VVLVVVIEQLFPRVGRGLVRMAATSFQPAGVTPLNHDV
jgi:hypothetical protein